MPIDENYIWMVRIRPGGVEMPVADDELAKRFMDAGCQVELREITSLKSSPELLRATVLRRAR